MAVLTFAERERLIWVTQYIERSGGGGRYLDTKAADELAKIFGGSCGFKCACGNFQQALKNAPVLTLLKVLSCETEGLVVPGDVIVAPIDLGLLCSYGILAGTTVTNTGPTIISGDLGLSPGSSVTGFPPGTVLGETHITDAEAAEAQIQLTAAYLEAESRVTPTPTIIQGDIGGQTFTPGIYKAFASLEVIADDIILDAQGNPNAVFLFQVGSALTLNRNTILVGGAQARNIIWQVGSSATLNSGALVKGSILALTSITAVTGATVEGRLLARNGAVTLDSNVVVVQPC